MKNRTLIFFVGIAFCFGLKGNLSAKEINSGSISLAGEWALFIDYQNQYGTDQMESVSFNDHLHLPGTLDEAQKGIKNEKTSITTRLTRKYSFSGRAWYRREIIIPAECGGRDISLFLERTRVAHLWVDRQYVGSANTLSAPQRFQLPRSLSPGKHILTLMVDNGGHNGLPAAIHSSHMWSDDTQTNWNGVIGRMLLEVRNTVHFTKITTYPDIDKKSVRLKVCIENSTTSAINYLFGVNIAANDRTGTLLRQTQLLRILPGTANYEVTVKPTGAIKLWDEFTPNLYSLTVTLSDKQGRAIDKAVQTIGLLDFRATGKQFTINGKNTFLRGKHDACSFPLTGHPPMDLQGWLRYFDILKSYGFNHVRFHSWCPPEAAFEAADMRGFYLQPELPIWGGIAPLLSDTVNQYLLQEGKAILDSYGNHPSFVMFSNGNELWGSVEGMTQLTDSFRRYDNRHLYALGSNFYLGWQGELKGEDFSVTCRVGGENDAKYEPHVRASFSFADAIDGGLLNASCPNTLMDFAKGAAKSSKPIVSHETGQYQMYPDFSEISHYTGVLYPYNLITFRDKTTAVHCEAKVRDFFKASSALSLICYKADIEMELRTPNLAGFQLLDIQDYPGQGTAIIGMLNALMESKDIVTPKAFSKFCGAVVPLLRTGKFVWKNSEMFSAKIQVANYSNEALKDKVLDWKLVDEKNQVLKKGSLVNEARQGGISDFGDLSISLSDLYNPVQLKLILNIRNTGYSNQYDLWVYPEDQQQISMPENIKIFSRCNDDMLEWLRNGGNALLLPDSALYSDQTVGGLFTPDYWNYSMFKTISENNKKPVSPGTLGLLIRKDHPALALFPTEFHSNWQWWAPVKYSRPIILDGLSRKLNPIVEPIDNVERNHRLAMIFECGVGKGKLLVCMADLQHNLGDPACRQLYKSLIGYVSSIGFRPEDTLSEDELTNLFRQKLQPDSIQGVKNVSY